MDPKLLIPIAVTGFSVAFFHAAIPTHWLPFVMTARAQKWSRSKTLAITALAGLGHIFFTTFLGLIIVVLGIAFDKRVGEWFPFIAGGALVAFGAYYLVQQARGHTHSHLHLPFGPKRSPGIDSRLMPMTRTQLREPVTRFRPELSPRASDRVAILSLLALLTFSPCESFLPVYLSALSYGWIGFAILSSILAIATLSGMILLTWIAFSGLRRLRLSWLERYESAVMGVLLIALGLGITIFEH